MVVFQHARVVAVGDVEIPRAVHRHIARHAKVGGGGLPGAAIAAAGGKTVGLAEHLVGGGIAACQRLVIFQHPAVGRVGHVKVAIHRHPEGLAQRIGGGPRTGIIAAARVEAVVLSQHHVSGGVTRAGDGGFGQRRKVD